MKRCISFPFSWITYFCFVWLSYVFCLQALGKLVQNARKHASLINILTSQELSSRIWFLVIVWSWRFSDYCLLFRQMHAHTSIQHRTYQRGILYKCDKHFKLSYTSFFWEAFDRTNSADVFWQRQNHHSAFILFCFQVARACIFAISKHTLGLHKSTSKYFATINVIVAFDGWPFRNLNKKTFELQPVVKTGFEFQMQHHLHARML